MIVHISGAPGVGKTTLGNELSILYPKIIVKDTDDFAHNLSQDDGPLFIEQLTQTIEKFISEHCQKNIVIILVGILDITHNNITYMVDMKKITLHLFYLDIPLPQLLSQFYTRITDVGKHDVVLWTKIAQGTQFIPSSKEIILDYTLSKQQHLNMGYTSYNKSTLLQIIQKMLCNNCQSQAFIECFLCNTPFCGNKCASTDLTHASCIKSAQYLSYIDTNYIFGTKDYFTLWKESNIVTNRKGDVLFRVNAQATQYIFSFLDLSKFHKYDPEKDHPQCCDIPYRVIKYGGKGEWIVNMEDVPKLEEALYDIYKTNNRIYQTRMRAASSMK